MTPSRPDNIGTDSPLNTGGEKSKRGVSTGLDAPAILLTQYFILNYYLISIILLRSRKEPACIW